MEKKKFYKFFALHHSEIKMHDKDNKVNPRVFFFRLLRSNSIRDATIDWIYFELNYGKRSKIIEYQKWYHLWTEWTKMFHLIIFCLLSPILCIFFFVQKNRIHCLTLFAIFNSFWHTTETSGDINHWIWLTFHLDSLRI